MSLWHYLCSFHPPACDERYSQRLVSIHNYPIVCVWDGYLLPKKLHFGSKRIESRLVIIVAQVDSC